MHGQNHNDQITDRVGRDKCLDHGDIISAFPVASPLRFDGFAEENAGEDKGKHPEHQEAEGDFGGALDSWGNKYAEEEAQHACFHQEE